LAYYTEVPGVIWDIQRVGPSTGLPTRTSQGDILSTAFLSHGDTKHILLIPSSVEECYTMAGEAFDLAEQFQTLVFVMSDLDLGMNNWMSDPFKYPEKPLNRGKVLGREELDKLGGFSRYKDVDGDGIPYRSLPGVHPKGAYFTRGSGHNKFAGYTEDEHEYTELLDRIDRKIQGAAKAVPQPIVRKAPGAKMGLITVGGCHAACIEALDLLAKDGVPIDFMRVRGFPFGDDVKAFVESHDVTFVVEQNRDAQLRSLLVLETGVDFAKLESVRYYGGFPMSAHHVIAGVRARLERAA